MEGGGTGIQTMRDLRTKGMIGGLMSGLSPTYPFSSKIRPRVGLYVVPVDLEELELDPWVCCQCKTFNDFTQLCGICGHIRCTWCESEEDEDLEDFMDLIIMDEPEE
jgi:hypothetical protein